MHARRLPLALPFALLLAAPVARAGGLEHAASLRAAAERAASAGDAPDGARRLAGLLASLAVQARGPRLEARYRHAAERFVAELGAIERARGLRPPR